MYKYTPVLLVLLVLLPPPQVRCSSAAPVPLVLWSPSASSPAHLSALSSLSQADFQELLTHKLKDDPFTVLFVEENLSVEDLSLRGVNPYTGTEEAIKQGKAQYFPAVNGPVHVINQLFRDSPVSRVSLTDNGLTSDITSDEEPRLLVVRLRDAKEGEARLHFLARHDAFITDMIEKLQDKHGEDGVSAVYTGRAPSWSSSEPEAHSRARRQAEVKEDSDVEFFHNLNNQTFFYAYNFTYTESDDDSKNEILLENPVASIKNISETEYQLNFKFTNGSAVDLQIKYYEDGYWYMKNVTFTKNNEELELENKDIYAPRSLSYHCPRTVYSHKNVTTKLFINELQLQPFFQNAPDSVRFRSAYDCIPYFTIPIWSSLIVVFLLLFFLFIGVVFMMNIHTMDRFDDPKGKTITINTSE